MGMGVIMFKKILYAILMIILSFIVISTVSVYAFISAGRNIPKKAIKNGNYDQVMEMYVAGFFTEPVYKFEIPNFGSAYIYNSVEEYEQDGIVKADLAVEIVLFPSIKIEDELKEIKVCYENGDIETFSYRVMEDDKLIKDYWKYYLNLGFVPRTIYYHDLGSNVNTSVDEIIFLDKNEKNILQIDLKEKLFDTLFLNNVGNEVLANYEIASNISSKLEEYNKETDSSKKEQLSEELKELKNIYNKNLNEIIDKAKEQNYHFSATIGNIVKDAGFLTKVISSILICAVVSVLIGYLIFRKH